MRLEPFLVVLQCEGDGLAAGIGIRRRPFGPVTLHRICHAVPTGRRSTRDRDLRSGHLGAAWH